jgi:hypothetical protein
LSSCTLGVVGTGRGQRYRATRQPDRSRRHRLKRVTRIDVYRTDVKRNSATSIRNRGTRKNRNDHSARIARKDLVMVIKEYRPYSWLKRTE